MWTRVCVMARCLCHHAAAVCGGFAAEPRAGRRYRSPVVGIMPSSSGTMATCDFEVLKKFLRNYYFASYPRRVCLYVWLYVYLLKASKKVRKSVSKSLLFLTKREQCIRNGTSETRCETQIHKKQVFFQFLGSQEIAEYTCQTEINSQMLKFVQEEDFDCWAPRVVEPTEYMISCKKIIMLSSAVVFLRNYLQ